LTEIILSKDGTRFGADDRSLKGSSPASPLMHGKKQPLMRRGCLFPWQNYHKMIEMHTPSPIVQRLQGWGCAKGSRGVHNLSL